MSGDKVKVCKHCGTSEGLIVDKLGRTWSLCLKCKNDNSINKNVKICKYCKTTNEEDFIRKNGKCGLTVCTNCFLSNLKGENNPFFSKQHTKLSKGLMSDSHIGKYPSRETLNKMSESHKRENLSDETLYKLKTCSKNRWNSKIEHEKLSISLKYTLKDYIERWPWIIILEEMRDAPIQEIGKAGVQVRCKKCNDWYTPYSWEISNRINAFIKGKDYSYFYCSDNCKHSCPLFGLNSNSFINRLNESYNIPDSGYLNIWKKEVFARQLLNEKICYNHCEKCNSESNLHVHHEKPQKTHPHMALDPDNGIILCGSCHSKFGHINECSTGSLANKICIDIKNIETEIV